MNIHRAIKTIILLIVGAYLLVCGIYVYYMNKLQKNIVQKMISNIKFQFKKNEFMLKMGDKTEKHKYEIKSSNDNDLNVILDNDDKIKVKFKNKNEAIFKGASDKLNFYMRKTN